MSRREEDEAIPVSLPWVGNDPWEEPPTWGYPKVRVPGGPTPDDDLPCVGRWELFDQDVATTEARRLCATCPFSDWCFSTALANNETGIWAGTTFDERYQLKKKGRAA